MKQFLRMERVSLAALPDIMEYDIQQYIFDHPDVLNLGEVRGLKREKKQAAGGRVDIILEDGSTWYETEIQLGATDPSHIIRTIEYWDNERWRYPQYNHVAVLIAEEITGRFFNVISLFNKHIPLIAYQMTAFRTKDGELILTFSKVLDLVTRGQDEDVSARDYNYDYWVEIVGKERMEDVLKIFHDLFDEEYSPKYTKNYVGVRYSAKFNYFMVIFPYQKFIRLRLYMTETDSCDTSVSGIGEYKNGHYDIRVSSYEDYLSKRDRIKAVVKAAADEFGADLCYEGK